MALARDIVVTRGGSVFCLLFIVLMNLHVSLADVGTAAQYSPPYTPTACYGYDPSQFPTSFLFAAAGEGIWDNGAACGRQYLIRCISGAYPGICDPTQMVQVRILDLALTAKSRPSASGATIVLSNTAFKTIANPHATSINIEYIQV